MDPNCYCDTKGLCQYCDDGYFLTKGPITYMICKKCPCGCKKCKMMDTENNTTINICTECDPDYILLKGVCLFL